MLYRNKGKKQAVGIVATIKELAVLLLVVFLIRTFGFGLYQVPTGSMETTMLVGERFFADKLSYLFRKPERNEIIALNEPTFNYSDNKMVRLYQEYVGWPIWPWGPVNFTKRVIGVPGDHVKGVIENGKPVVYLNDNKLNETYLNEWPLLGVWDKDDLRSGAYPEWRSYVPSKPFDDQPYYCVKPSRIIRAEQIQPFYLKKMMPGLTVTSEGFLLKEPGRPAEQEEPMVVKREGNFWTDGDEFDVHLGPDQYWLMGDNRRGSKDSRFFGPVEGRLIHGRILYRIWSIDSDEQWWIIDLIKHPIDFWKRMRWNRFFQRVV